jgi:hypothetical protein
MDNGPWDCLVRIAFLFDYMFAKSELLVGDYIRNKLELRADGWSR